MSSLAAIDSAAEPARLLSVEPSLAFWLAIVLYAGAAGLFLFAFAGKRPHLRGWARGLLIAGFLAHGVDIGWRGVLHVHPAASVREALGFMAWMLAGGYLLAGMRFHLELAGSVVTPVVLVILAAARLSPTGVEPQGLSTLGRIHITMATIGVAIFAVATALSAIYLLEERNLKRKRFDTVTFKHGTAPLEALDRMAHRLVVAGFPVFTVAMVLGVLWVSERGAQFDRPEYPLALITWLSFAALIVMRLIYGWRGRRTARLTLVGFAAAMLVLLIYFLRRALGG